MCSCELGNSMDMQSEAFCASSRFKRLGWTVDHIMECTAWPYGGGVASGGSKNSKKMR